MKNTFESKLINYKVSDISQKIELTILIYAMYSLICYCIECNYYTKTNCLLCFRFFILVHIPSIKWYDIWERHKFRTKQLTSKHDTAHCMINFNRNDGPAELNNLVHTAYKKNIYIVYKNMLNNRLPDDSVSKHIIET